MKEPVKSIAIRMSGGAFVWRAGLIVGARFGAIGVLEPAPGSLLQAGFDRTDTDARR